MSYTHLTTAERVKIETYLGLGMSIRSIARRLGQQPSTVLRKIRRNPDYTAKRPQERYAKAKENCGTKTKLDDRMRLTVIEKLRATWSLEQIVGHLYTGKIAFSTIYRWIYSGLVDVPTTGLHKKDKRQKPGETRGRSMRCTAPSRAARSGQGEGVQLPQTRPGDPRRTPLFR